jgi:hypothetical protein
MYAVHYNESYTVPGDERSRTNPGHGYPEHTVTNLVVKEFKTEDELKNWVLQNSYKTFKAYKLTPLTIERKVDVIVRN